MRHILECNSPRLISFFIDFTFHHKTHIAFSFLVKWRHKKLISESRRHHDDVIRWKRFPRYWPFMRGIHRSPVISPHKGQWRGALMFSLICVWIYGWVNNGEAGDLWRYRAHYDVTVMIPQSNDRLLFCNEDVVTRKCFPLSSPFGA